MRTLLEELKAPFEPPNGMARWTNIWENQQKIAKAFDEHYHTAYAGEPEGHFPTTYPKQKFTQEPTLLQAAKEYVDNTSEFKFGGEVELSLLSKLRAAVEREEGKG